MSQAALEASAAILSSGYARVRLAGTEASHLRAIVAEARKFFSLAPERRARYASTETKLGYRSIGHAYQASDRPDWNECFTLWSDRVDLVPRSAEIQDFLRASLRWRSAVLPLLTSILAEIGKPFGAEDASIAEAFSFIQVNSYSLGPTERDLLQDQHEDGYLLTAIHTTAPGLEVRAGGRNVPLETAPDEVLVIPGLVLADLTASRVPALRHQVRNHQVADRLSVLYFGGADMSRPMRAWTTSRGQGNDDLRAVIRGRASAIRLPDDHGQS